VKRDCSVILERDEEGFHVTAVAGLAGCPTAGRSPDEIMDRLKESIQVCLEAEGDAAEPLPSSAFRESG